MKKGQRALELMGTAARRRGRDNERRVLQALLEGARPEWLESARMATNEEDHRGIDVVVASDVGDLYLQVKSSKTGAKAARPSPHRALVIARAGEPLATIKGRALTALAALRKSYLDRRSR
ncbi:MAG TPA: hypothetical protein VFF73_05230 [Planctomycetota bacterium]|nr:hypothetical protein [Planctomycetota bacterium]